MEENRKEQTLQGDTQDRKRTALIKRINSIFKNPKTEDKSYGETKTNPEKFVDVYGDNKEKSIGLEDAINDYFELVNGEITTALVDDYIKKAKKIIELLKPLEDINSESIELLSFLIKPLEELNKSENQISGIAKDDAVSKICDDNDSMVIINAIKPITNKIAQIISQKYRLKTVNPDNDAILDTKQDEIQDTEKNKIEKFKEKVKEYKKYLKCVEKSGEINEDAYNLLDTLNSLTEIISEFVEDGNRTREDIRTIISPLEEILNINNRIIDVIKNSDLTNYMNYKICSDSSKFITNLIMSHKDDKNPSFESIVRDINSRMNAVFTVIINNNNIEGMDKILDGNDEEEQVDKSGNIFLKPWKYLKKLFSAEGDGKDDKSEVPQIPHSQFDDIKVVTPIPPKIVQIEDASLDDAFEVLDLYSYVSRLGFLESLQQKLESQETLFYSGKINDLKFIVIKKPDMDRTDIYTNKPDMGHFEFGLENNNLLFYKNSYWQDEKKHVLDIEKSVKKPLNTKKKIKYSVYDIVNKWIWNVLEHQDVFDEMDEKIVLMNNGNNKELGYNTFLNEKDRFSLLEKHGMSKIAIDAIKGDLKDTIPPEIFAILKKYSPEVAKRIEGDERIFVDDDGTPSY